ncbi:MAG: hypothetical protein M0P70_17720, partial [Desulfobulbaceae bacterium]|nr:hypothetical protein [Desulfobulbaceae bacterium]
GGTDKSAVLTIRMTTLFCYSGLAFSDGSPANTNSLQGTDDPKGAQQPENHCNNHHGIQNFLYGLFHRYVGVDQPQNHPNDNQNNY